MTSRARSAAGTVLVAALLSCALLMSAATPAVASSGNAYQALQEVYSQAGSIPLCRFSAGELAAALKEAPTYNVEYSADFTNAVQAAIANQASGACAKGGKHHRHRISLKLGFPGYGNLGLPGGPSTAGSGGLPLPLVLVFALAGVAVVWVAVVSAARMLGLEPSWAGSTLRSLAEAGYQLGGAWEELTDRFRRSG